VQSYRDAWRHFLRFTAKRRKRRVADLQLEDLQKADVLSFLNHIEHERHSTTLTRNCRLAALRSFSSFVADHEPLAARQCAEVLHVPFKRAARRAMVYLDSAEVASILSQPDRSNLEGQRDHALLSLLYNTGSRIQEALNLRPQDVYLKSPAHVRLMGKGQKERIAPIWPETAELLTSLIERNRVRPDEFLFVNRYGAPLSASGFRFRLRQYVRRATVKQPTLSQKRITPHVFRHYSASRTIAE